MAQPPARAPAPAGMCVPQAARTFSFPMPLDPLPPEALYRRCDPADLPFATTDEVEDIVEMPGQERALAAVRFGIGIRQKGYNLFALGAPGTGKHTTVRQFLDQAAAAEPVPPDLCYVNNFEATHRPIALALPPGTGARLKVDMQRLIEDLQTAIPAVFESEDYRNRKQVIDEEFKQRQESAFEALQEKAQARDIAMIRTPMGLALAPTKKGEVLSPDEFRALPENERKTLQADLERLQKELEETVRQFPDWDKNRRDKLRALNREVTSLAVGHGIAALRESYRAFAAIVAYLDAVERDIIQNADAFLMQPAENPLMQMLGGKPRSGGDERFRRYLVNVVVDSSGLAGAPVVYEDSPTHPNLVGRVEHQSEMGALVTDFSLIKAGALHRANGGYLLLDMRKLLMQPYAWEGLKRVLYAGEIRIESLGQMLSLVSTVSLEPQAVPLNLKVVLVGERELYYLLCYYDPDFPELFKVAVDFDDETDRNGGSSKSYARLVATVARREGLKAFDRAAVARVIEHCARLADDAEKLTTRLGGIADLLREADYWAGQGGRAAVAAADVQQAIDAQIHRSDRLRERSHEMIQREILLIDTSGTRTGQVNGLSVVSLGGFAFGRPSRITATVRLGRGEVIDIERKVELGGPIHSKGVLILSSFLAARYAIEHPLSLSASLVFEQSYGGVEGDSASSAELYTLLSALADLPVRQTFAVTGSVNQHGEVQAIGGVNEKIEGFFDICAKRGLTGDQGVLIPIANTKHLMLRADVVAAVAAGKFRIFAVRTIDEGIELLTGTAAGARDPDGKFPAGSVNRLVEDRLIALAERRLAFGKVEGGTANAGGT
jgi:lon-related putative ATP-dependent protease